MGKRYLLSAIIVFFSVFTYAQNYDLDIRWKVIDTPVIFPDNFTDWIKRNIGEKYSGYNNLTNKILTIRNHYGIVFMIMLAYPYDIFENKVSIISKELKKLEYINDIRT